jgi:hypothetical protein
MGGAHVTAKILRDHESAAPHRGDRHPETPARGAFRDGKAGASPRPAAGKIFSKGSLALVSL